MELSFHLSFSHAHAIVFVVNYCCEVVPLSLSLSFYWVPLCSPKAFNVCFIVCNVIHNLNSAGNYRKAILLQRQCSSRCFISSFGAYFVRIKPVSRVVKASVSLSVSLFECQTVVAVKDTRSSHTYNVALVKTTGGKFNDGSIENGRMNTFNSLHTNVFNKRNDSQIHK